MLFVMGALCALMVEMLRRVRRLEAASRRRPSPRQARGGGHLRAARRVLAEARALQRELIAGERESAEAITRVLRASPPAPARAAQVLRLPLPDVEAFEAHEVAHDERETIYTPTCSRWAFVRTEERSPCG